LIDPGLGLHGPIGIPELSTFDLQLCMILTVSSSFFVPGLYKFLQASRIMKLFHKKKKHAIITTWHLKNLKENIKRFSAFCEEKEKPCTNAIKNLHPFTHKGEACFKIVEHKKCFQ
jgi:hypothetical protein